MAGAGAGKEEPTGTRLLFPSRRFVEVLSVGLLALGSHQILGDGAAVDEAVQLENEASLRASG